MSRSSFLRGPPLIAFLAAALIVGLGAWQIVRARQILLLDAEADARNLSRSLAQQAARTLEAVDLVLSGVVHRLEADALADVPRLRQFLEWSVTAIPQVGDIAVADANGNWLTDSFAKPHGPINIADRPYFVWQRDHADQGLHFGLPIISRVSGEAIIPLSRRWNKPDGSFGGVVRAALRPDFFQTFYEQLGVGSQGSINLMSTSGRVLARYPIIEGMNNIDFSNSPLFREKLPKARAGTFLSVSPVDGIERIAAYERVENYPLVIFVGRSTAETLESWRSGALVEGAVLVLAASGLMGFGLRLASQQRRASENERRYRALADALPQIVWIARAADGEASYLNGQFEAFYGPIGTSAAARLACCHAGDDQRLQSAWQAVEEGRSFELEMRLLRHDGEYRWHKLMMIPVRRGGELIEWIGTALDIHEIVKARANLEQTTNLLRLAQDAAGAGVWEWDIRNDVIRQSIVSARMHGLIVEEQVDPDARIERPAQQFETIIHSDDLPQICAEAQRAITEGTTYRAEYRVLVSGQEDAVYGWVQSFGRAIFETESGDCIGIVGLNLDVTERKQAEAALRLSEESLTLALDGGTDGLWDWNVTTGALSISGRFFPALGYEVGEIDADIGCWSKLVHPDDAESALNLMREYLRGHSAVYECEYRLRTKAGAYRWTLARGKAVARDQAGRVTRMVGTYIDVTRRKEAEQQIAHMAVHDSLTGLPNRLLFRDRLEREIMWSGRQESAYALLACDLDGFKAVNDALGHPAGDTLLRAVAARLQAIVRETDTIARLGGDEFAIIMSGLDLPQAASAMAQRMIDAIAAPFDLDGHSASVGISIGIALGPQDGRDPDKMYKNADLALYRAKAAGRNTFRFYEPGMDAAIAARHGLELDLREAVQRGGFALHYQPIVSAATSAICGFEALMRWQHPLRGPIPPAEFIPIAEETGLIVALGRWALHEACRKAASWPDDVLVAVNISMIQFAQPGLDQTVLMALSASGLPAHRLELEITESVLMEDAEGAVACLHRLRGLGVRIALDDFGTGFSSLSYLRRFPFDKIKIDRSFIRDIANPDTAAIVRAIVGIGGRLGAAITAEGVETQDQLEHVQQEGCTQVQGYLFSRPLPAEEALAYARVRTGKAA